MSQINYKSKSGVALVLKLSKESIEKIHSTIYGMFDDADALPKEEYHLTIKYLGKKEDQALHLKYLVRMLVDFASTFFAQDCKAIGVGRFLTDEGDGTNAVYLSVDGKDLNGIYNTICRWCDEYGIYVDSSHGFTPHITIGYIKVNEKIPDIQFNPFSILFDECSLWFGDTQIDLPLMRMEEAMPKSSKAVWTTAYMNDLPDSSFLYIESGGKKDEDGKTIPRSKRHFPYKDASGKIDLPHLRNAIARIPQSNAPGLNKIALQSRARKLLSGTSSKSIHINNDVASPVVFKQSDGKWRWVLFSSNPYKDRDGEYVTQLAHERDIEMLDREGYAGQVLRLGHIGDPYFEDESDWTTVKAGPGADIGQCDFAAMHGRIRIESGTFYNESDGQAIADHADEIDASQAFAHPRREPDHEGGFLNIKSFERSLLTPKGMASNLFTGLMVSKEENTIMDPKKLKAFKDLGVDIESVLKRANGVQKKADRTAPYRLKSAVADIEDEIDEVEDEGDLSTKLDRLTEQMTKLQEAMKDGDTQLEPEEKFEDLMVKELTVGELQDLIGESITRKSAEPVGIALKAIMEEIEEIKELLTSKSVQSVVDEVARMKAKLERQTARLKAVGSKVRELDDDQPRVMRRGVRPSESDDTLLDDDDDEMSKKSSSQNPFSWIDEYIQKPGG